MIKLNSVERVISYLEEKLESIGIKLVDTSIYKAAKSSGINRDRWIVVVVGCHKACIFTVYASLGNDFHYDHYSFSISGQLKKSIFLERKGDYIANFRLRFQDIPRFPTGSETYDFEAVGFMINHSFSPSGKSREEIEEGIVFYQNFLNKYGKKLRKRFAKPVHLFFAPRGSEELSKLEAKNGRYSRKNYIPFNERVMAKFPQGFFAKNQRP